MKGNEMKKTKDDARTVAMIKEELDRAEAEKKILELRETALHNKIEALTAELQHVCTHPKLKQESRYCSGSYDERASTFYWKVCTTCGTKSDRRTETHSYYG